MDWSRAGAIPRLKGLTFGVLGPVQAQHGAGTHRLGGRKQRTVLALLVAAGGRRLATDTIIEAVYGGHTPSRPRRVIQTYISNLRHELGDVIQPQPDGYLLEVPRDSVDATEFEDLIFGGVDLAVHDAYAASCLLRSALRLWRGEPYADVDGGPLLTAESARLTDLWLLALETRIETDLALLRHRSVVAELKTLTASYPYRERLRELHMLALYRSGRQAEALGAYEETRSILLEELGVAPSLRLADLNLRILQHDPEIAADAARIAP